MKFTDMYHGRLALVDLADGTAASVPLSPDCMERGLGGGALAAVLAEQYPGAMFFCSGPLVGSYAPASGLMTISCRSSESGGLKHAIHPLGHGAWLRQSGFDALVVTGRGAIPRIIRCFKGACFLEDAAEEASSRAKLRASLLCRTGKGRAALILANCVNTALPVAAGAEYGSFSSGTLVGPAMRERNILALCLEGGSHLPPMPIPLDNPLRRAASVPFGHSPLKAFFQETKLDFASVRNLGLKSAACFHCPSPCLAWVTTGHNAYLLVADHGAFTAAAACGKNIPACLAACDEAGVDPRIAGSLLKDVPVEEYSAFLGAAAAPNNDNSVVPPPGEQLTEAERTALVLGMCPRLVRRRPGLSRSVFDMVLGKDAAAMLARSETLLGQEVWI